MVFVISSGISMSEVESSPVKRHLSPVLTPKPELEPDAAATVHIFQSYPRIQRDFIDFAGDETEETSTVKFRPRLRRKKCRNNGQVVPCNGTANGRKPTSFITSLRINA